MHYLMPLPGRQVRCLQEGGYNASPRQITIALFSQSGRAKQGAYNLLSDGERAVLFILVHLVLGHLVSDTEEVQRSPITEVMHKKHQQIPNSVLYQMSCRNIFLKRTELLG